MNEEVPAALRELIARHGTSLVEDPRRLLALLRDAAGEHRLEISLIEAALQEGVPAALLGLPSARVVPERSAQLARQLEANRGISPAAARWAVDAWARALNPQGEPSDAAVSTGELRASGNSRRRIVIAAAAAAAVVAVAVGIAVATRNGDGTVAKPPTTTVVTTTVARPSTSLEGDPARGKLVFRESGCGSCHTLRDAGTTGTVGPNLDESKPSLSLIVRRVTDGRSPMPSFSGMLTRQQIADVADYVFRSSLQSAPPSASDVRFRPARGLETTLFRHVPGRVRSRCRRDTLHILPHAGAAFDCALPYNGVSVTYGIYRGTTDLYDDYGLRAAGTRVSLGLPLSLGPHDESSGKGECPGDLPSEGPYTENGKFGGRFMCEIVHGTGWIIWTHDRFRILALAFRKNDPRLRTIYRWWYNYSGPY